MDLNPAQHQAVYHPSGPLLILAGAGSGKTRVITSRIAELCHRGVPPRRILAVTFTNKAAGEMRERAERLLSGTLSGMWIGTFHSTCARLLRIHAAAAGLPKDFVIFDDSDQLTLLGQILREISLSDHAATPRAILSGIDKAKNAGKGPDEYQGHDFFTDLVARVYPVYQQRLRQYGAVDFGDLLMLPLSLAQKDPAVAADLAGRFDHVLCDEFQDTNRVQYRLLCLLAKKTRQLVVVGDDDQAIYGWRGADVRNLLDFEQEWPDAAVVKLEENYRSTQIILTAANAVIARNRERRGKELFTSRAGGELILYHTAQDERREATYVARTIQGLARDEGRSTDDFAVCYRTNAQSRALEEALRQHGIPYTVIGGTRFYDRAEVKDVMAYLRLCQNPSDEVALRRVINVPTRGIGESTVKRIQAHARGTGSSMWQALLELVTSGELSALARRKLLAFAELIEELRRLQADLSLSDLAEAVTERTGYFERLAVDGTPESASRRENIMELIGSIREREREAKERNHEELRLIDYLEQISLNSSVDTPSRGVSLMTVHAAKGLEFAVVVVTGLEDGLFPSLRRMEEHSADADPIAEERRLAYVALTRARERLVLTNARQRRLFGQQPRVSEPSRFLKEIPPSCLLPTFDREAPEAPRAFDGEAPEATAGSWGESDGWEQGRRRVGRGADAATEDDGGYRVERDEDEWDGGRGRRSAPPTNVHEGDTLRVEYDEPQVGSGAFRLGQVVRHRQFGSGEVRALSGHGSGLKATVYFPHIGARTVMVRFLSPE